MVRPVAMDDENPRWPRWLSQGKKVAQLIDEGIAGSRNYAATEVGLKDIGLASRTARRFESLYRFLLRVYPAMLRRRRVLAGSTAVMELMKLHEHSAKLADKVVADVLSGTLTHDKVRAQRERVMPSTGDTARKFGTAKRIADFEHMAVTQIRRKPELLGLAKKDRVELPVPRKPLVPDLLFKQGDCTIAVEIKAAGPRRDSYIVGSYLARLAQLLQRYDRAILVLPGGCEELAQATVKLQREWGPADISIVCLSEPTPRVFDVRTTEFGPCLAFEPSNR